MKSYAEVALEVGLDLNETAPELENQWVAYIGGEAIPCKTMNEAIAKSSLYENVVTEESHAKHRKYFEKRDELEVKATTLFKKYLREEYLHLDERVYNICVEAAFEDNDSDSYDAVASRLSRNIELYNRIFQRI